MIQIEIRKKIVEARKKGLKISEIVKAYGYSESAINRLLRLERETGDITPKTHLRGRKKLRLNYNSESAEDLTMTIRFKDAREGRANMKVYRIDEDMMWYDDTFEFVPTENRMIYVHEDYHFSIYAPENSVIMITFDYDV